MGSVNLTASVSARSTAKPTTADELAREIADDILHSMGEEIAVADPDRLGKIIEEKVAERVGTDRSTLAVQVRAELIGYGPLQPYVDDPGITDIHVNGVDAVSIYSGDVMQHTPVSFGSKENLTRFVRRIAAIHRIQLDDRHPLADGDDKEGLMRIALTGPNLTPAHVPLMSIRKHHRGGFTEEQLLESGTFTIAQRDYLKDLVLSRKNIVIAGPTGEGKTTLLRYLASLIPETDRVLIIEERIELNIEGPNRVSLLAQNPVAEDSTVVSMDQLLTHALRMQPQRMILGELRSAEALNLLIAFGTGHNGGLTTIHANDPEQAVDRLVFMMSSAGRQAYSDEKLVDLIRMSVDNIIYVNHRKLQSIAKVGGKGEPLITMVDI